MHRPHLPLSHRCLVLCVVFVLCAFAAQAASRLPLPSYSAPTAYAGSDQLVQAGTRVTFYGVGTSMDKQIVSYRWDFDGDGHDDYASTSTGITRYIFRRPGIYPCRLTVADGDGALAYDTCTVTVLLRGAPLAAQPSPLAAAAPTFTLPLKTATPADGVVHRYALLIQGAKDPYNRTNVALCYDMLTERYGFTADDIILLTPNGLTAEGTNPDDMIDGCATLAGVREAFAQLAALADQDDQVSIWFSGDGGGYFASSGYVSGRVTTGPGGESDCRENAFKLRWTIGSLDHWSAIYQNQQYNTRRKVVSHFSNVYISSMHASVSDSDPTLELLTDYLAGDTNQDGVIDANAGEVADYDHDGIPPYDPNTGAFDEGDWGPVDTLTDNYNSVNTGLPDNAYPILLFDNGLQNKLCIDLHYQGGTPHVDGCDEDNDGTFDWLDANQDGDLTDWVSIDETITLADGAMLDDEFAGLLDLLHVGKTVLVLNADYSGGFIKDCAGPNRIICTSTTEVETSSDYYFIRWIIAALHGASGFGGRTGTDTNNNGGVSILEAYTYAKNRWTANPCPFQYEDTGDGMPVTNPQATSGDGVIGASSYFGDLHPTAHHFALTGLQSYLTVAQPYALTVTAKDSAGRDCPGYLGTVSLHAFQAGNETIACVPGYGQDFTFDAYAEDGRYQCYYTPGEIRTSGTIGSLAINVTQRPDMYFDNFTIRMRHYTGTSCPTTWINDGWTTVYRQRFNPAKLGWTTCYFTQPFTYNGTDNLLIDISYDNPRDFWTPGPDLRCQGYSAYTPHVIMGYSFSSYGDPRNWTAGNTPTNHQYNYAPCVKLGFAPVSISPATSTAFSQGTWQSSLTFHAQADNVVLSVEDENGATGSAGPISIRDTAPLSDVHLATSVPNISVTDNTITLSAVATGGANLACAFLVNGQVLQDYSSRMTCPWTPTQTGQYTLQVKVKDLNGADPTREFVSPTLDYAITQPCSALTFTTAPAVFTQNGPITLTATATGGANLVYAFFANSTLVQDYSAQPTCTWTPTASGRYDLLVRVRDLNGVDPLFARYAEQLVTVSPQLSSVALAANLAAPREVGTAITLTATATGGGNVRYEFLIDGVTVQAASATNTYQWTPTVDGNYTLSVKATDLFGVDPTHTVTASTTYTIIKWLGNMPFGASPAGCCVVNTPVSLTAHGWGLANPIYTFYVNGEIVQQGAQPICTWTPAVTGSYDLQLIVRDQNETDPTRQSGSLLTSYNVVAPLSKVVVSPDLASPRPANTAITLKATATGGARVQYQFLINGEVVRDYDDDPTYAWDAATAGTYTISVKAKELNGTTPATPIVSRSISYRVVPCVTLNVSPRPSQPVRTPITVLATADGMRSPRYRFRLGTPDRWGRMVWSDLTGYGTANTITWRPTTAKTYTLTVWVREKTSTAAYDAAQSLTYTITAH